MTNAPMTWTRRQPWMQSARCVDRWDLFDFTSARGYKAKNYVAALQLCRVCPVQAQCERYVESIPSPTGVWAGAVRGGPGPQTNALCGTTSGYYRHRHRGEDTCQPCRDAVTEYQRQRKQIASESGGQG